MSAPTVAVEWLLARAAVRSVGLLHIVSRRNSGALNPLCGANPIRSEKIEERHSLDDVSMLCEGCGALAMSMSQGSVLDGVAMLLGLATSTLRARLLEVPVDGITTVAEPRCAGRRLTDAVRQQGVVTPLVLRRVGRGLVLLDGGRRLDAARAADLLVVPAVVQDLDDREAVRAQLLANLHRQDLDPIAQATAFRDALEHFDSITALADELGLSRSAVSNTMRLLRLPDPLQEHVAEGRLSIDHARELLTLDGAEQRVRPAAPRAKADPQLAQVAALLAGALDAKARITPLKDDMRRITLDVPADALPRLLAQIGLAS